jgi:hypothetical protein
MIKLKSEVNKSQIMRELKEEAKNMYDDAYEGEYAIEQFLLGAESLFKKLRIGAVMESDCDHEWLNHSFDHFGFLQEQICDKCGAKQSVP